MNLFLDGSAASSGSGPTYLRNVVPQLAVRTDVRSTVLVSPSLRQEFHDLPNISFVTFGGGSGGAALRFLRSQRELPELIRQSGANVLLSVGNIALFRSPVPQILLSGNALYTSRDFFRDLCQRRHYGLWLDTRIKGVLAEWSIRAADRTVAPSTAFAKEIKSWTGVGAIAIHHGFDRELFFRNTDLPEGLRAKLARKESEFRLLFVSHYNYYRNFETLIRAVAALRVQLSGREVRLFLTCQLSGDENPGSFRPEAAGVLVRELGLARNIVELGSVPYQLLHHVYRACDAYVTPAYVETFAHPLVEAMASGLPVIASDLAVHREVGGDAALYFSTFSAEGVAEKVRQLAESPELCRRMSERGLVRSRDFSWKEHVTQILSLAESLTIGSPG